MKLTQLKPRWFGMSFPAYVEGVDWASHLPIFRGISFECPHCRTQRLGFLFDPPINPSGYIVKDEPAVSKPWKRISGETFETVSFTPSVDASFTGHWHGFITNGEVT